MQASARIWPSLSSSNLSLTHEIVPIQAYPCLFWRMDTTETPQKYFSDFFRGLAGLTDDRRSLRIVPPRALFPGNRFDNCPAFAASRKWRFCLGDRRFHKRLYVWLLQRAWARQPNKTILIAAAGKELLRIGQCGTVVEREHPAVSVCGERNDAVGWPLRARVTENQEIVVCRKPVRWLSETAAVALPASHECVAPFPARTSRESWQSPGPATSLLSASRSPFVWKPSAARIYQSLFRTLSSPVPALWKLVLACVRAAAPHRTAAPHRRRTPHRAIRPYCAKSV